MIEEQNTTYYILFSITKDVNNTPGEYLYNGCLIYLPSTTTELKASMIFLNLFTLFI